ncbi:oxidoreductase, zinc-binding dehydrogenase family protein [Candidatus Nitrosopumilus salaria BD31]|uniref:Oxidoreductase, zinc-binding dehydrogenase family protein n=1 Tax=Candidatus Nitrosopumilus salarius BD31 TaxID=859350 RepID=I3D2P8_9ARCH|nr:zinc-dependent dehydrogenase [Candidatus Nitrosopumilus salaria]EIJ65991.1 oxidoreductase, zinc-binding dehydrogenase family protein [Candidatus Nitrosopumilus salaria BD31]
MKTASVKESGVISVDDVETPQLNSGDILIQMESCGICGSDLEKVFGHYGQPSMRLGHEPAGIVLDVGSNVTSFKKGDRVFTHHHVPCYDCHFCNHGNETMCPKYYETNLSPCGLSEKYIVPAWNVSHDGVLKISEKTSFEEAALIEPLACCVRAWTKFPYQQGDSAAIFGVGPTGMMHVMLAHAKKFSKIFCLDVNDFRLNFAKKFNITESINSMDENRKQKILDTTDGLGVDVAIVATSSLKALEDAIGIVRKGGSVMMFGVPSKGAMMNLDMSIIYSKEITLVTSYAASDKDTTEALNLIESSQIDVKQLITHTYSINDSQKAFDHARTGENAMKIIITK